jgi:transmembrane sensor
MSTKEVQDLAAEWLAREDRGLTASEQVELTAWLEQSTLHEVSYLRLQAAWERTDRLAALNAPPLHAFAPPATRRSYRAIFAALAAAALIAVGLGYRYAQRPVSRSYATAIGATQSLWLADGTHVELNSDTRLRTEISAENRSVTLESGEAYFEVVHDAKRPFVVYAGTKRITDLGTKFSVYRKGDDVRVIVKEGRVQVGIAGEPAARTPVVAEAGHVVVTNGPESLVSRQPERDIANDLSWRSGILVFDQQTLLNAANEFNRYNAKQLVIEGNVRDMRIGGRFKANNVASFILLLHRGFGLTVEDRGSTIVVSR